ncbi:MAG: ribosome small subunit-dependent GTPase A [Clostridia bacterium]|nr:ribosome small subunit-dependent GTPase A [Clostridia bacterium]
MSRLEGLIIKGIGGFYYVETAEKIYECKARGKFRIKGLVPVAGDRVELEIGDSGFPAITQILSRKNFLIRPPVANIDRLFVVVSACKPAPSTLVIDKLIALAEDKEIEPVILLSKSDLESVDWLYKIYTHAGFETIVIDYNNPDSIERIKELMSSGLCALAGNSGVGKSTLLNAICPQLNQKTAVISEKLGRGRHTTREVELFDLPFGGKIADTPGFSSLELEYIDPICKENLPFCFREFSDYLTKCKFTSCSHTVEKGCAILEAVEKGNIEKSRHESYTLMYNEVKDIKDWEKK